MALIAFESGSGPVGRNVDGVVAYDSSRGAVARAFVKPNYPRTESQVREVAGVTAAARAWSYTMTTFEQSSYDSNGCLITISYEVWIWLRSILTSGFDPLTVGASGGPAPVPPSLDAVTLSPGDGVFEAGFSGPPSTSGGQVLVSASRPVSPGRVPRVNELRTLGLYALDTPQDLMPAYEALWPNGLGPDAPVLMRYQWVNTTSRTVSCPETVLIYPGTPEACELLCDNPTGLSGGVWTCVFKIRLNGAPLGASCAGEVLTAGWGFGNDPLTNLSDCNVFLQDLAFNSRTETVQVRVWWVDDDTQECTAGVELTVINIGP